MLSTSRSSSSAGARVTLATSNDDRHPPECIIDGNPDTYWLTTGLYPQEVVISLPSPTILSSILVKSISIRKLRIEKSENSNEATDYEMVIEKDLDPQGGQIQSEEFKLKTPTSVRHLKLVLLQGYEHFSTVHSVTVTSV